jgi:hypothetical protein
MNPARLFALSLVALLVALAGCGGSSPKSVTKAQYQAQLAKSGQAITIAGQQLGKVITIADFNGAVSDLQQALRDGEKNLKGFQPPQTPALPTSVSPRPSVILPTRSKR